MIATHLEGFTCAGVVGHTALNIAPPDPPFGRRRHAYGDGPFARLVMPPLPASPGLYAWELAGTVVYLGQTRTPLTKRLGPMGYGVIHAYNTLAREPGRTNGGQQTNCRVNALANTALTAGASLTIWYRLCPPDEAKTAEAAWMARHGLPSWNRRLET